MYVVRFHGIDSCAEIKEPGIEWLTSHVWYGFCCGLVSAIMSPWGNDMSVIMVVATE